MRRALICAAAMTVAAALLFTPTASAVDQVDTSKLRKGLTTGGILDHMRAFQRLANANGGTRAASHAGLSGFARLCRAASEARRLQAQARSRSISRAGSRTVPPCFSARAALRTPRGPARGGDYMVAQFAGSGNVTAPIVTTGTAELPPSEGAGSAPTAARSQTGRRDADRQDRADPARHLPVRRQDRPGEVARRGRGADLQRRRRRPRGAVPDRRDRRSSASPWRW